MAANDPHARNATNIRWTVSTSCANHITQMAEYNIAVDPRAREGLTRTGSQLHLGDARLGDHEQRFNRPGFTREHFLFRRSPGPQLCA
jgi:hypothetical protein